MFLVKFNCCYNWVFFGFEVCFEFFDDFFEYVFFIYILSIFFCFNMNSFLLEGKVNFLVFVVDEVYKVVYFFFFSVFVEWFFKCEFVVLIEFFLFFVEVCSSLVYSWLFV